MNISNIIYCNYWVNSDLIPEDREQKSEVREQKSEDRYSGFKSSYSARHALCPKPIISYHSFSPSHLLSFSASQLPIFLACPAPRLLGHHVGNRLLQSINGQFKHGKNFTDGADGAGVIPHGGRNGIQPNGMGKGFGDQI